MVASIRVPGRTRWTVFDPQAEVFYVNIAKEVATGAILKQLPLSGVPDVVFFNAALRHIYVAVGDPGALDVFDTASMQQIESVHTEKGTLAAMTVSKSGG
jgi:hypothetical protein